MKIVAAYLENAIHFDRMAALESDPKVRKQLEVQAAAYRTLAEERTKRLKLPPQSPSQSN
jgi:hypothetical protein